MRLLIIGGTHFVGRAIAEAAARAGHDVTIFSRGRTPLPQLDRPVEHIVGDRDGGLHLLAGRTWDAAVDTCGYVPRLVGASARALTDAVGHYTFISTISVYADHATPGGDESGAVGTLADEATETITGETYGPLKVLCERVAEAAMPGRVLHVRAGLIIGPHDPTDRFTYWVRAGIAGRRFVAPGPAGGPLQVIDARDIATFVITSAESRRVGTFDTVGGVVTWGQVIDAVCAAGDGVSTPVWATPEFLEAQGIAPFTNLPLWVHGAESAGVWTRTGARARGAGLVTRPLAESVRDIAAWDRARGLPPLTAGISLAREAELLAALDAAAI